nr:MOSC domain-containing protein [Haliscomenobacter sp.]
MFTITQLHIYPVKSLAGIALQEAKTTERGFEYDRRWMLIDENNQFLTQRNIGALALLETEIAERQLRIRHKLQPEIASLKVPLKTDGYAQTDVQIWDDVCRALLVSKEADAWLSEALGSNVRLAYLPMMLRARWNRSVLPCQ